MGILIIPVSVFNSIIFHRLPMFYLCIIIYISIIKVISSHGIAGSEAEDFQVRDIFSFLLKDVEPSL